MAKDVRRGRVPIDPAAGAPVPYRVAADLLQARLEALAPFEAGPAEQGVVVGSLEQLRGQSPRLLVLLGFAESAFPRGESRDVLDLRQARATPLDLTPREQDLRVLLEVVLSVQDALLATCTAQDPQTGHPLEPSSALVELGAALERTGLLAAPVLEALRERHRLRRYDPVHVGRDDGGLASLPTVLPEAHREARAAVLGAHVRAHLRTTLPAGADLPAGHDLLGRLAPEVRAELADLLGLVEVPPARAPEPVVRVSVRALREFLLCPLQAWARHRLRLKEEGDGQDPLEREDEAFAHDEPGHSGTLQAAFWDAVRAAPDAGALPAAIAAAHERHALRAELGGEAPTGLFGVRQRAADETILEAWRANLARALGAGGVLGARPVRLGTALDLDTGPDAPLPVLTFDVELPGPDGPTPVRVEVHGTTRPVLADRSGVVRLSTKDAPETYLLEAFLDHAVLAAAGACAAGPFRILVVPGSDAGAKWGPVPVTAPFDAPGARAWLSSLLRDFLGGPHDVLLPAEAALRFLWIERTAAARTPPGEPPVLVDVVEGLRRSTFTSLRSDHGPVRDARDRFDPPPDGEAIVRRRHGPFEARVRAPAPAAAEGA